MVDSAIITVLDKNDNSLGDFELPIKITIEELSKKMVEFLKAKGAERYIGLSKLKFQYKNKELANNETLYENEVWDGSFLKIIF